MLSQYRGEATTNLTLTKNNHDLDKTDKTANSKRHEIIIVWSQSARVLAGLMWWQWQCVRVATVVACVTAPLYIVTLSHRTWTQGLELPTNPREVAQCMKAATRALLKVSTNTKLPEWRAISLSFLKFARPAHYARRDSSAAQVGWSCSAQYQASQHQHSAELSC